MAAERLFIGTTANGMKVYADTQKSHAATHLLDTPELLRLVKELIPTIIAEGDSIYRDKDMGRPVGLTDLVDTKPGDEIIYVKRLNRDNYTRFVKGRKAEQTPFVTIVLKKNANAEYELWSTWIGRATPQFPHDEYETSESRPFWRTHALVWGNQKVQSGTERHEWPWGVGNQPSSTSQKYSASNSQSSSSKVRFSRL